MASSWSIETVGETNPASDSVYATSVNDSEQSAPVERLEIETLRGADGAWTTILIGVAVSLVVGFVVFDRRWARRRYSTHAPTQVAHINTSVGRPTLRDIGTTVLGQVRNIRSWRPPVVALLDCSGSVAEECASSWTRVTVGDDWFTFGRETRPRTGLVDGW